MWRPLNTRPQGSHRKNSKWCENGALLGCGTKMNKPSERVSYSHTKHTKATMVEGINPINTKKKQSVCLSVFLLVCLSVCRTVRQSLLSVSLFDLSVVLSVSCLSVFLYLFVCLSVCLCMSVCLCLLFCLSFSRSVYQSIKSISRSVKKTELFSWRVFSLLFETFSQDE